MSSAGEIPLIIFDNLTKIYGTRQTSANGVVALDGVSLQFIPVNLFQWLDVPARVKLPFLK